MKHTAFNANVAGLSHRGRVRGKNEDLLLFGKALVSDESQIPVTAELLSDNPWLITAIDGIGGARAGATASQYLGAMLLKSRSTLPEDMIQLLHECNASMFKRAQSDSALVGMGAALAGLAWGEKCLFAFNVGDCRVYRSRDRFLEQITRDDSTAQMFVDIGVFDSETVRPSSMHSLTQAIGGRHEFAEISPHVYPIKITHGSRFLICTDGLTDMLTLDQMEVLVQKNADPSTLASALIDGALEAGGKDNISVIVADITPVTEQT